MLVGNIPVMREHRWKLSTLVISNKHVLASFITFCCCFHKTQHSEAYVNSLNQQTELNPKFTVVLVCVWWIVHFMSVNHIKGHTELKWINLKSDLQREKAWLIHKGYNGTSSRFLKLPVLVPAGTAQRLLICMWVVCLYVCELPVIHKPMRLDARITPPLP